MRRQVSTDLPDSVLAWAVRAVSPTATVASVASLHPDGSRSSGTFRVRLNDVHGPRDLVVKVPVPGWINTDMVATNGRALELAERHDIAAPRLLAADLDGRQSGVAVTVETFLPGSSALPPAISQARLRAAGAALAQVHAIPLTPRADLPYRPRPIAVDDFARERRTGQMPTTPSLQAADDRVRAQYPAIVEEDLTFVHGDVWGGNMLWEADTCRALIDWKTAGAGHPGVDLGELRMQMALQYGKAAPEQVLHGWEQAAGRCATDMSYWDAVAALNTPTVLTGWPGFADDQSRLHASAVTQRRDAFLSKAIAQL